jgi:hypothetical protein
MPGSLIDGYGNSVIELPCVITASGWFCCGDYFLPKTDIQAEHGLAGIAFLFSIMRFCSFDVANPLCVKVVEMARDIFFANERRDVVEVLGFKETPS